MKHKSILMPYSCQKGSLFILAYIALFLICLSREKGEDEMISAIRRQTATVMAYVLFILLFCTGIFIGICLAINPDIDIPTETLGNVVIRFFLIAAVYEIIFKIRLWLNCKYKSE